MISMFTIGRPIINQRLWHDPTAPIKSVPVRSLLNHGNSNSNNNNNQRVRNPFGTRWPISFDFRSFFFAGQVLFLGGFSNANVTHAQETKSENRLLAINRPINCPKNYRFIKEYPAKLGKTR